MPNSFIQNVNTLVTKIGVIEEANTIFDQGVIPILQEIALLDLDQAILDLKKGNYLGNRKIDINLALNMVGITEDLLEKNPIAAEAIWTDATKTVQYSSATVTFTDGVVTTLPFIFDGVPTTISTHGDLLTQLSRMDYVTAISQVDTIGTITAVNSTAYTVTINGTAFTYTSDIDATVIEITAGIAAAINAGVVPVTAVATATTVVLTADTAGTAFSAFVNGNMLISTTTANRVAGPVETTFLAHLNHTLVASFAADVVGEIVRGYDVIGQNSNLEKIQLHATTGAFTEANPVYYWAKTTSAFQTLSMRAGDIIKLGNDIDSIITLASRITEMLELQSKIPELITNVDSLYTNIAKLVTIHEQIVGLTAIYNDIKVGGTNYIQTVSTNITNINAVATDLNLGVASNVKLVGGSIANVNLTGGSIANVNTAATNIVNVNTTATNIANVNTVGTSIANINTVASNTIDIDTVAAAIANVNTTAGNIANVNSVGVNIANVNTVATNIANVNSVVANATNINATAVNIANVNAVGADLLEPISEINTVAMGMANVDTVATAIANVNSVATTIVPNIAEILLADTNAATATAQAVIATTKSNEIKNVSVSSTITGAAGTLASVVYNPLDGKFTFVVPQGNKGDKGDAFLVNAVGLFAGRSIYDGMAQGFSFLALDLSQIYFKLSATSGDWSAGAPFGKGDTGATGATGNGIAQTAFLSTTDISGLAGKSGATDTYRITYTDTTTDDFLVYNGLDSAVASVAGRTGAVVLTKSDVGLANVDNTTDLLKPVSTATQSALDLKANIASPTFTGTVGGITKTMVGLGNVDDTTDLLKPISTAAQSALDLKADEAQTSTTTTSYTDKTTAVLYKIYVDSGNITMEEL